MLKAADLLNFDKIDPSRPTQQARFTVRKLIIDELEKRKSEPAVSQKVQDLLLADNLEASERERLRKIRDGALAKALTAEEIRSRYPEALNVSLLSSSKDGKELGAGLIVSLRLNLNSNGGSQQVAAVRLDSAQATFEVANTLGKEEQVKFLIDAVKNLGVSFSSASEELVREKIDSLIVDQLLKNKDSREVVRIAQEILKDSNRVSRLTGSQVNKLLEIVKSNSPESTRITRVGLIARYPNVINPELLANEKSGIGIAQYFEGAYTKPSEGSGRVDSLNAAIYAAKALPSAEKLKFYKVASRVFDSDFSEITRIAKLYLTEQLVEQKDNPEIVRLVKNILLRQPKVDKDLLSQLKYIGEYTQEEVDKIDPFNLRTEFPNSRFPNINLKREANIGDLLASKISDILRDSMFYTLKNKIETLKVANAAVVTLPLEEQKKFVEKLYTRLPNNVVSEIQDSIIDIFETVNKDVPFESFFDRSRLTGTVGTLSGSQIQRLKRLYSE